MSVTSLEFRHALACWPSGVSIVTAHMEGRDAGMTVSSFFSVSLEPPLIGVCIDRSAMTLASVVGSGSFCVNLLSEAQAHLSTRFATPGNELTRFDDVPLCAPAGAGAPRLEGCLAYIDCQLERQIEVGDHVVCFGLVVAVEVTEQNPLVFQRGQYRSLS